MQAVDVNIVAVVVAAAVAMVVGALWYGTLFANRWLQAVGKRKSDLGDGQTAYMGAGLAALVTAFILANFVGFADATTFIEGATVGLWAWFGFVVTTALNRVLWEDGSKELYLINIGQHLVSFLLMGGILAIWV